MIAALVAVGVGELVASELAARSDIDMAVVEGALELAADRHLHNPAGFIVKMLMTPEPDLAKQLQQVVAEHRRRRADRAQSREDLARDEANRVLIAEIPEGSWGSVVEAACAAIRRVLPTGLTRGTDPQREFGRVGAERARLSPLAVSAVAAVWHRRSNGQSASKQEDLAGVGAGDV